MNKIESAIIYCLIVSVQLWTPTAWLKCTTWYARSLSGRASRWRKWQTGCWRADPRTGAVLRPSPPPPSKISILFAHGSCADSSNGCDVAELILPIVTQGNHPRWQHIPIMYQVTLAMKTSVVVGYLLAYKEIIIRKRIPCAGVIVTILPPDRHHHLPNNK